jgi:Ca2+-binding EF-hand superfamily protein
MQGYKSNKDVPVLVNDSLSSEILKNLLQIFHKFDNNQDDCLGPKELDLFVFSTNGQHPATSFIEQMGQRFSANEKGWLTKKGYLVCISCILV